MKPKILLVSLTALASCGSPAAPSIEIVSVGSTSLRVEDDALDDLTIRIRYRDDDGDLGGGRLSVHDCRDASFASRFEIDPIVNDRALEEGVAIEGEIVVTVADIEQIDAAAERPEACTGVDPAAFCVIVEDSAGNQSEPACTEPITYATSD